MHQVHKTIKFFNQFLLQMDKFVGIMLRDTWYVCFALILSLFDAPNSAKPLSCVSNGFKYIYIY